VSVSQCVSLFNSTQCVNALCRWQRHLASALAKQLDSVSVCHSINVLYARFNMCVLGAERYHPLWLQGHAQMPRSAFWLLWSNSSRERGDARVVVVVVVVM